MRRHWKDFAGRSAKAAFSPDQVSEALPHALKKEILEAPIKEIRDIMGGDSLFPEMRIERLDALRQAHRGSAAATHVIDCAVEAAARGLTGEAGTHAAVKNAIEDTTRDALRGIEEHYQREASPRSSGYVRTRLDAARQQLDSDALTRDLLSSEKPPSRRSVTLPRHTGVDEGPSL
ncbi:MAG: hypothetical protein NVV83_08335 [Afipia sp.]|nr:hypothetical protein [Afipia sp.]